MRRVAILGYGLAGEAFHAPLVAATAGLDVAAILTRDPERRRRAAERYPGAVLCDDADAAIAAADLVVVAAPNDAHVPLALRAVAAGRAVVVDKPVATSAADARRLADAAAAAGVPAAAFHNRRWDSDYLTVRRLVDEGALGDVVRLESRFERWRPQVQENRWRERADAGGGVLMDLGPHVVDQALQLLGPAVRVYAEVQRRRPGAMADDDDFVAIEHASGARSHLSLGMVFAAPGPRFRVLGTGGAYVVGGLDGQEAALRAGRTPTDDPGWGEEPEEAWGTLTTRHRKAHRVPTEPGRYQAFYAAMAAALEADAPPPVPLGDAISGLEVLEAAQASAARGEVVTVG